MVSRRSLLAGLALLAPQVSSAEKAPQAPAALTKAPTGRFASVKQYSREHGGSSLLIRRNGVVLAEDFTDQITMDRVLPLGEITQAVAGLMAAALARRNVLEVEEPASRTLTEWAGHPQKQLITVRQLLNGVSGFSADPKEPNWLLAEPKAAIEQVFDPHPGAYQAFAELARRKIMAAEAGGELDIWFQRRVLTYIESGVNYQRNPPTLPDLFTGAGASTRSLANIGDCVRLGGLARAQYLLDPGALNACFIGSAVNSRFGMGFWLGAGRTTTRDDPSVMGKDAWSPGQAISPDFVFAAGRAGQRLYVSRARRLVIVRLVSGANQSGFSDATFLRLALADL